MEFRGHGNHRPACSMKDDCDYVPTKPLVLFGHHFASIAGGGPIIGPTTALLSGFLPVWLWAVLGIIFIGCVHDMTTLFARVREKGKSISEIAKASLGNTGFFLFIPLRQRPQGEIRNNFLSSWKPKVSKPS